MGKKGTGCRLEHLEVLFILSFFQWGPCPAPIRIPRCGGALIFLSYSSSSSSSSTVSYGLCACDIDELLCCLLSGPTQKCTASSGSPTAPLCLAASRLKPPRDGATRHASLPGADSNRTAVSMLPRGMLAALSTGTCVR